MKNTPIDYILFGVLIGIAVTLGFQLYRASTEIDLAIQSESAKTEMIVDGYTKGYQHVCLSNMRTGPHTLLLKTEEQHEEMILLLSRTRVSARGYGMQFTDTETGFLAEGNVSIRVERVNCKKEN